MTDLMVKMHGQAKLNEMEDDEVNERIKTMPEKNTNEDHRETSWATVVSRGKQLKNTNKQGKMRDLQTIKGTENAKGNDESRSTFSQQQEMINRLKKQTRYQREYKKEATLTLNVKDIENTTIIMIIKAVEDKSGIGKIIGLWRKANNDFELTMQNELDCEDLLDGIMINGQKCDIRKLCATEKMVSFLN